MLNDTDLFQVAGVPSMCTLEGVQVINICTLIEHLYPGYYDRPYAERPDYKTRCEDVMSWCKLNKAHSYERDRESFSKYEAACEARDLGLRVVVVEDLS